MAKTLLTLRVSRVKKVIFENKIAKIAQNLPKFDILQILF